MQPTEAEIDHVPAAAAGRRKVALFIRSLKGNGAQRSTMNLAGALAERGLDVDLVLVTAEGPLLGEVSKKVRVVDLGVRSGLGVLKLAFRRPADFLALAPIIGGLKAPRTLGAIDPLAHYLRQARPVALLSALDYGNVAAILAAELAGVGTRIVISQRNQLSADVELAVEKRVARLTPVVRRFYPRADAIVAVSEGVAEDLARVCGLPRERVTAIYNAVVDDALAARAAEPTGDPWFDGPRDRPTLLAVGKLKHQKDYPTMLRAFARLRRERPVQLGVLGDGPDREALEAMTRDLGIADDVRFLGFSQNPFAYMAKADCFVLSSAFEGLPGVLIQALACGAPSVSTDCPSGPREILDGGRHGPLVPVGDDEALSAAIAATLDAPPDRAALKARGGFFSFDRAADAYLDMLVGPRPSAAGR